MRLTAKAEYGCIAVIALASHRDGSGPIRVKDIADTCHIPERYLVQILLQLKAAGLVHSARGSSGGYRLARDPREISLGEVLGVIEGPGDPPREISGPAGEALTSVWKRLQFLQRDFLNQITIAQLAGRATPQDWVI
jgi:Rrf2 family transcriptional regulator, cysteine metabolism repressor